MEKKTPLYDCHVAAKGKIVPFAGYLLPVQYPTGLMAEHELVRKEVGIFDVSHMGEAILEGSDALKTLNYILTNDFTSLAVGGCRYSLMLYPNGTAVDDLIVYRLGEEKYLLVLNASNTEKDVAWLSEHLLGDTTLTNLSDDWGQIALQGPKAKDAIAPLCDVAELPTKYYGFKENVMVAGVSCLVSRTGYTGEFGYEIYMAAEDAPTVWDALIAQGVAPCGLGARDTLRLEAAMPLYGHELSDTLHAGACNLGFAIKMAKEDFIGKDALGNPPLNLPTRVGLKVTGRGIVREDCELYLGNKQVGTTTSGTHCPHLGAAFAMGYVEKDVSELGTALTAKVRGRDIAVEIVKLPFYQK